MWLAALYEGTCRIWGLKLWLKPSDGLREHQHRTRTGQTPLFVCFNALKSVFSVCFCGPLCLLPALILTCEWPLIEFLCKLPKSSLWLLVWRKCSFVQHGTKDSFHFPHLIMYENASDLGFLYILKPYCLFFITILAPFFSAVCERILNVKIQRMLYFLWKLSCKADLDFYVVLIFSFFLKLKISCWRWLRLQIRTIFGH